MKRTDTKRTELVFILDRSGSMHGLEQDTIGGFNAMLDRQKKEPGRANVTTILFDDAYEVLHRRADIRTVRPMTDREYTVRGCTALLDAMGRAIREMVLAQRTAAPRDRADKVLFVIITDGRENASREYTARHVRAMVEKEREGYGWEFLFLGANIDAIAAARTVGISADRAVDYCCDSAGTQLNYETVSRVVSSVRSAGVVPPMWQAEIQADRKRRGQ